MKANQFKLKGPGRVIFEINRNSPMLEVDINKRRDIANIFIWMSLIFFLFFLE